MPRLPRFLKRPGRALSASRHRSGPDLSSGEPRDRFVALARTLGSGASVLDLGTKQSVPGHSSHWFEHFPGVSRQRYVMADVEDGADVDVVADAHAFPTDWTDRYDAVVAVAVFEHLERPWIAASEVARVLAPGGTCYISTHQTFPLHGYPSDFFRFSTDALSLIFRDTGLDVISVAYEHRADIVPPAAIVPPDLVGPWNDVHPSYIAVHLLAQKPGERT